MCGLVQAAARAWFSTWLSEMEKIASVAQHKNNLCTWVKHDKSGSAVLETLCHADGVLLIGKKKEVHF